MSNLKKNQLILRKQVSYRKNQIFLKKCLKTTNLSKFLRTNMSRVKIVCSLTGNKGQTTKYTGLNRHFIRKFKEESLLKDFTQKTW